ncbi:hypothetical protein A6411_23830 [Prescottella equi]|uniref:hypothetical protein n=1 Tax=Rhodococcus hoagii TaxID=43767 RepID=UPI0009BE0B07|nr:hypothetical protein [Prescottella equi]OQQ23343.1 hypothetical protein A6411_23830 [Prescottella equi]
MSTAEQKCPACGATTLEIEWRLEPKPIGSHSLAGVQMKVAATSLPWLVCRSCGVEAKGKQE